MNRRFVYLSEYSVFFVKSHIFFYYKILSLSNTILQNLELLVAYTQFVHLLPILGSTWGSWTPRKVTEHDVDSTEGKSFMYIHCPLKVFC